MKRRTEIQLTLLIVGLVAWASGQRFEEPRLQWAGIACFAVATLLRVFKKKDAEPAESTSTEPPQQ
jgi:hypothetical protein